MKKTYIIKGKYECPKCNKNIKLKAWENDGHYSGEEHLFDPYYNTCEKCKKKVYGEIMYCESGRLCDDCYNKELKSDLEKECKRKLIFLSESEEWLFSLGIEVNIEAFLDRNIQFDLDNDLETSDLTKHFFQCSECGFSQEDKSNFICKKDNEKMKQLIKEVEIKVDLINNFDFNNLEINEFIKLISKNNDLKNKIKNLEKDLQSEKIKMQEKELNNRFNNGNSKNFNTKEYL